MAKAIKTNQMKKNLFISICVQIVSLVVNLILNLILPKCIDEFQYAYWQTYFLYVGYVGVLHFGLLDGIVLRYSQFDYDELDKPRLRSQFKILLTLNTIMTIIVTVISIFATSNINKYIFIFVAIGIITKNVYTYSSYAFQITNRIDKYAIQVISMRVFYGLLTVIFLCMKLNDFRWFCIADLSSDLFGVCVGYIYNKEIFSGKSISFNESIKEFTSNIVAGAMLLISNWSSSFLVGSAKMIIQWHWDDLTFGKVTFSFSVSTLFLTFVNAVSVVLFPSLKRMNKEQLPYVYKSIRDFISPLLFLSLLFYFPGCYILNLWLPKYNASLAYLGILLPIIIFSSKVTLLTNNYLKAYRMEKKMLTINLAMLFIAIVIFTITAFLLNNLTIMLLSVVLLLMARSIISEIVVMRAINVKIVKDFYYEAAMTVIFMICASRFNLIYGFLLYLLFFVVYCVFNRKNTENLINKIVRN